MQHLLISLAQAVSETQSTATAPLNPLFHDWGLASFLIPSIVALLALAAQLSMRKHEEVRRAVLALKSAMSSMFIKTVISESHRLFALIDDHLPRALSQENAAMQNKSRFDYFCEALRKIPEAELVNRGRYAEVVREVFSGIVSQHVSRLLEAVSASEIVVNNPLTNPTGIRFSLEADGELRFAFLGRIQEQFGRYERWYNRANTWTVVGTFIAAAALCIVIPAIFANYEWCYWFGIVGFALFSIGGFIAVLFGVIQHQCKRSLVRKADTYEPSGGLEDEFTKSKSKINDTARH